MEDDSASYSSTEETTVVAVLLIVAYQLLCPIPHTIILYTVTTSLIDFFKITFTLTLHLQYH